MNGLIVCMHFGKRLGYMENVKYSMAKGICAWCKFKTMFFGKAFYRIKKIITKVK